MTVTEQPRKTELIDRLAEEASRKYPDQAESVARFVREYFALVAPDDLNVDPQTLLGGALSLWEFGAQRKPEESKVRLFNPTMAEHGWNLSHTVMEIVNDDMPFLVDSIIGEMNVAERNIHLIIHPVLTVRRDAEGNRETLLGRYESGGKTSAVHESHMHFEIDQETEPADLEKLKNDIETILSDVRLAVADWLPMRARLFQSLEEIDHSNPPIPGDEVEESKEFLRWLADDHFVFLGYRQYQFVSDESNEFLKIVPGSGLGLLREVRPESRSRGEVPFSPEFSRFARRKELI
ncbi:MAG: NAD-glutamate dehydrogenase, partial [Thermoanaerobaculia bacterium]